MIKDKNKNKLLIFLFSGIIISLAFILSIIRLFSHPHMMEELVRLNNDWEYNINNSEKSIHLKNLSNIKGVGTDDTLYLKHTIKEDIGSAYLMLNTINQNVIVYLDDKIIYEKVSIDSKNPGISLNIIELGNQYKGKELKIALSSPYKTYCGKVNTIYLCKLNSLIAFILAISVKDLIMSLICISIGFIGIYFFISFKKKNQTDSTFLFFSLFCISLGLYFPSKQPIMNIFFDPVAISNINLFLLYIQPLCTLLLIYKLCSKYKRYISYLVIGNFIFVLIITIGVLFKFIELPIILNFYYMISIFSILIVIYTCYSELKLKNPLMPIVALSSLIIFFFGIIDFLNFKFSFYDSNILLYKYSLLVFVVAIGFMYFSKFISDITNANSILQNNQTLKSIAYTDELTKLKNRAAFDKMLYSLSLKRINSGDIAIIVFDLNRLKSINDNLGHMIGDKYIKLCADCLNKVFVNGEQIFRIGGDEFVVISIHTNINTLQEKIKTLYDTFERYSYGNLQLSVAYGFEFYDGYLDRDLYSTFNRADKKMYMFKSRQKSFVRNK